MHYPQAVGINNVKMIACGEEHSLALTSRGLYAWGVNQVGQLGLSDTHDRNTPALIPNTYFEGHSIIQIGCGKKHSVALTDKGCVYTWGHNLLSQLGLDASYFQIQCSLAPVKLKLSNVKAIAVGSFHTLALTPEHVFGWGYNSSCQLGSGPAFQIKPLQLDLPSNSGEPIQIACGGTHSMCLTLNETQKSLLSWGDNEYSQTIPNLSTADLDMGAIVPKPRRVLAFPIDGRISISAGYNFSMMIKNGTFLGWGKMNEVPHPVYGAYGSVDVDEVLQVSCGMDHSIILTQSAVFCFGSNKYGQLGQEMHVSQAIEPVQVKFRII